MLPANTYEILGYGVIGLGFLLAFLAYLLLSREQKREKTRKNMVKAIYTFMGFSILLCVIGFGSEKIKSGGPSNGDDPQPLIEENRNLNIELNRSISPSEFNYILNKSHDPNLDKEQFKSYVRELVSKADELRESEKHYSYNLFRIEKMMADYGNSIDTSIHGKKREKAYEIIQIILHGIKSYPFPINGDQQSTYEAVKKFQEKINKREDTNFFDPASFGVFGYRTLETIRSEYRRIVG